MKQQFVVIGASAAGISAITTFMKLSSESPIVCITQEQELPYNKCFLADYLSGVKTEQQVFLKQQSFFENPLLSFKLGVSVISIDRQKKQVQCSDGTVVDYTQLLLAVGSSMHMPAIKGFEGACNLFQFHTLNDAQLLLQYCTEQNAKRAVVIGGGLSGLECADSLRLRGIKVTVIERESQVMPRQLTLKAAEFVHNAMNVAGVELLSGVSVDHVVNVNGTITQVVLENGQQLETDLVVCALGVRPNSELAHHAGLAVEHGAVVTNEFLQTNDPSIFVAGDVAQVTDVFTHQKIRSCAWPDAVQQGMYAATNMAGTEKKYPGTTTTTSTSFFGIKLWCAGSLKELDVSYNSKLYQTSELFEHIVFKNQIVKGFITLGSKTNASALRQSLLTQTPYGTQE